MARLKITASHPVSCVAAQGLPVVVGDHVGQGGGQVDLRAWCGAVYFGVGAVQVADDTFSVEQVRVLAEVCLAGCF